MQKKAKIGKKSEHFGKKRQNWKKFGFFNDFWDTFWNLNNFSYVFDWAKFDPANESLKHQLRWKISIIIITMAVFFKISLLKMAKLGKIAENLENFEIL